MREETITRLKQVIRAKLNENKILIMGIHSNSILDLKALLIQQTGYFNHVAMISHYDVKTKKIYIVEALYNGIKIKKFEKYEKDISTGNKTIVIAELKNTTKNDYTETLKNAQKYIDKKYDIPTIIYLAVLNILKWFKGGIKLIANQLEKINPLNRKERYTCSEFLTELFKEIKINIKKEYDSSCITPTMLMKSNKLNILVKSKPLTKSKLKV